MNVYPPLPDVSTCAVLFLGEQDPQLQQEYKELQMENVRLQQERLAKQKELSELDGRIRAQKLQLQSPEYATHYRVCCRSVILALL